jgi:hypothetical protein
MNNEALRLADTLEHKYRLLVGEKRLIVDYTIDSTINELRRLHEENETLKKCLFQMQNAAIELAKPEQVSIKQGWDVDTLLAKPEQDYSFDRTASHMAGEYVSTKQENVDTSGQCTHKLDKNETP